MDGPEAMTTALVISAAPIDPLLRFGNVLGGRIMPHGNRIGENQLQIIDVGIG